MDERLHWLSFSVFPGVGPVKFLQLLGRFGSAKNAWSASVADLAKGGLGDVLAKKFDSFRTTFSNKAYAKKLADKGVSFVIQTDTNYPKLLLQIKNSPIGLFVKGSVDFNGFEPAVAIVGTRKITHYGKSVTELITRALVSNGFTIVSGLAMGVDGVAHLTTLENAGKTIAVLGCGVDCCSPGENQYIYDAIIQKRGAIVSELPIGHSPSRGTFPSRNRIIAGLSLGVVVTEGAVDSGSLITADYAIKNNRKVFAVPGPITSDLSKGPYELIKKGAKLVITAEDIIADLGVVGKTARHTKRIVKGDTKEEAVVLQLLQNESLHFDEIVRLLKMDPAKVGSMLSLMEIKGIVKSVDLGYFSLDFRDTS